MTMTIVFILIGVVVGFVVGFLIGRLNGAVKKPQSTSQPKSIQKLPSIPVDVQKRIQALIDGGHKIGALKELRDSTDLELAEAKKIIDSMAPSVSFDNINADKMGDVRDLIRSGKKDAALELYRESSGLGLKEAGETIDKMEKEFG